MLVLEEVRKSYADFQAVKSVSFTVSRGEILGLLGPNGAGKTTIMRILTGYHYPSSGKVVVDDLDIYTQADAIKNRIGYLPENAPLYPELSVAEYLAFQAEVRIPDAQQRAAGIDRAVRACSLEEVYHRPISELSKGYRQRVALAQAIVHDPDILILDEPTTGLDPNQINEIRDLIRELGREKTIILSTHIMQEVEAVCDRVLILHQGRIVAQGDTETIGKELRGDQSYYARFSEQSNATAKMLTAADGISSVQPVDRGYEVVIDQRSENSEDLIFNWCANNGVKLRELRPLKLSLEDIFRQLTSRDEDNPADGQLQDSQSPDGQAQGVRSADGNGEA